jgi:hypothetical protein
MCTAHLEPSVLIMRTKGVPLSVDNDRLVAHHSFLCAHSLSPLVRVSTQPRPLKNSVVNVEKLLSTFEAMNESEPDVAEALYRRCKMLQPRGVVSQAMREEFVSKTAPSFEGLSDYEVS